MTRIESFVLRQFARRKRGERLAAYSDTPFLRRRLFEMVDAGLLCVRGPNFLITGKGRAVLRSR